VLKTSLLNIALRLLSSVSRLVLFVLLAIYLPVEDVGRFGLVFASIQLFLYAAGLEFHQFATRALLDRDEAEWPALLRDQAVVHAVAYLVLLPASTVVFLADVLDTSLAIWFYLLLFAEHGCQELQRIMVTRSRPLRSNWIFFARSGAWVWVIAVLMVFWPATRDLRVVWSAWLAGSVIALGIGIDGLRGLGWRSGLRAPIERTWIAGGLRVAGLYFGAALAIRGVTTIDRYLLALYSGEAAVGVYALFFGIVNTILILAESGPVMVVAPDLIRASGGRDPEAFQRIMRRLRWEILALIVTVSLGIVVLVEPVLAIVGKPIFAENLAVCWILLAATAIATVGLIPHLSLYAEQRDRPIALAALAGLGVAAVAHVLLIPAYGAVGAAVATLVAMVVITGAKIVAVLAMSRRRD
jgi:O-antigen/teichoic acid export membrane protein